MHGNARILRRTLIWMFVALFAVGGAFFFEHDSSAKGVLLDSPTLVKDNHDCNAPNPPKDCCSNANSDGKGECRGNCDPNKHDNCEPCHFDASKNCKEQCVDGHGNDKKNCAECPDKTDKTGEPKKCKPCKIDKNGNEDPNHPKHCVPSGQQGDDD